MPVTQILLTNTNNGGGGGATPMVAVFDGDDLQHGLLSSVGWWIINGSFNGASIMSSPQPSYDAQVWPTYNGHVYTFTGTEYIIGPSGINNHGSNEITINYWFYPTINNCQLVSEYQVMDPASGYHYSMLEIDSSNHIRARLWPNGAGGIDYPHGTVNLNAWNHVYFSQDNTGLCNLSLNGNTYYAQTTIFRQGPGNSVFAFGVSDITSIVTTNRFQGKIGRFQYNNSVVASDWNTHRARFGL